MRTRCFVLVVPIAFIATSALAGLDQRAVRNVVLVSIDSLRADRTGVYGNPRAVSPMLDRLAAEGVRFERAISPTSWTLPAHATLLSGLGQQRHQVITTEDRLPERFELLPEIFARYGYETVGFYSGPFLDPGYGFAQGFESYVSCQSESIRQLEGVAAWDSSQADRTNGRIERALAAWIVRKSARPFFVFVHMWDVHYDYIPPEPYASMFDADYDGPLDGRNIAGKGFPQDASPDDVDHLLALYDGELRYTDATLQRVLARMEAGGLLDSTLIVITSDHGEEFREHGGKGHQRTLHGEVLHIPLIFWARSGLPQGRVVSEPVSLADVAPTILELAGLPGLESIDGRSLVPLIRGHEVPASPVFSELYHPRTPLLRAVSVQTASTKLIYNLDASTWQEFDLRADPGEHHPLPVAGDNGLKAMLSEYAERAAAALDERRVGLRNIASADPPEPVVERLRALGYLE